MLIRLGNEQDREEILSKYPYTSQVLYPGGELVVAVDNETIVGFSWSYKQEIPAPIERSEEFINVIEVFEQQNRTKGIASLMVQKIIEIARENDCYQVRAYCDMNNVASHKLWVKNDFTISPVKMPNGQTVGSYVAYKL